MNNCKKNILLVAILSTVAAFTIFPRLGSLPLREWDESRLAASAYEMYDSGNYLVATFDYAPDLWNTKPPLLLWLQALSIRFFGLSETAVRLPSALAMLFSALSLFYFTSKLSRPLAGFYSALIFLCSKGLFFYHCGRSADYDALMIMFCILYCGFFYLYTRLKQNKYLLYFFLCLALGVLTKGIQAAIPLAGIFIFALFDKDLLSLAKNRTTYIGGGIFVLLVGGFYFARECASHGYLLSVWNNEVGGRFFSTLEQHSGDGLYYYRFLKDVQFSYFFWLVPASFVLNLLTKEPQTRKANLFCTSLALTYFITITISRTKLQWYSLPIIPSLCVIIGLSFDFIHRTILKKFFLLFKKQNALSVGQNAVLPKRNAVSFCSNAVLQIAVSLAVIAVFYSPCSEIIKHNILSEEAEENKAYYSRVTLMKAAANNKLQHRYTEICYLNEERAQLDFFYYYYLKERGIYANRKIFEQLQSGDCVQANRPETLEKLDQHYEIQETDSHISSHIFLLKSKKQQNNGNISDNTKL